MLVANSINELAPIAMTTPIKMILTIVIPTSMNAMIGTETVGVGMVKKDVKYKMGLFPITQFSPFIDVNIKKFILKIINNF